MLVENVSVPGLSDVVVDFVVGAGCVVRIAYACPCLYVGKVAFAFLLLETIILAVLRWRWGSEAWMWLAISVS